MGISELVDYERFPKQGQHLGMRVVVCFRHDTSRLLRGVVVRDDAEGPGTTIIRLDDGRHVLDTECQYSKDLERNDCGEVTAPRFAT